MLSGNNEIIKECDRFAKNYIETQYELTVEQKTKLFAAYNYSKNKALTNNPEISASEAIEIKIDDFTSALLKKMISRMNRWLNDWYDGRREIQSIYRRHIHCTLYHQQQEQRQALYNKSDTPEVSRKPRSNSK